jgi:monoterpene epsilon-lactone hydrolase
MAQGGRARCAFPIAALEGHTRRMERGHLLPFPQAPDGVELRHLRAFVAVAEELNFGRAAARLYVSQPALSRQIRGLEQAIGCELLRRSTHRVELTLAGEALLDHARDLLHDVDQAVAATLAVGGELVGRVTKLWEPMVGLLGRDADLRQARAAAEELLARSSPPPGIRVRPATAGGIPSLIVSPEEDDVATVLYLHGGGYVLGSAFGYQAQAGALATAAQTGVLVPDYRLAPEHPFPAAVEDSLSAYLWLLDQGIAPDQVTVAGDSSGGGLALSLLLTLKQRRAALPGATVLFCPWVDLPLRLERDSADPLAPIAAIDEARRCAALYLAGHPLDDPVVDPLSADLGGLRPMLIQAATGDARLKDAKALAAHARDHGVDVRLELFPVDAHGFHLFWSFLPEAADAMEAAGAFIRDARFAVPGSRHVGAPGSFNRQAPGTV